MFKLFLVLVVSKWLARFSTICMRDGSFLLSIICSSLPVVAGGLLNVSHNVWYSIVYCVQK